MKENKCCLCKETIKGYGNNADPLKIICEECGKEIKGEYYGHNIDDISICLECGEDVLSYQDDGFYTYQEFSKEFYLDDELSDIPKFYKVKGSKLC